VAVVALEFHTITSREFFRLGAHGELDWPQTLEVLSRLVTGLMERGTDLALVDLRDARHELSDQQRAALADLLGHVGVRAHHRIAILFAPTATPRSPVFVEAARRLGFDVGRFYSYEEAAEWLSRSGEPDPEFDREVYEGPGGEARDLHPPPEEPR
jgi:hypothetical protein